MACGCKTRMRHRFGTKKSKRVSRKVSPSPKVSKKSSRVSKKIKKSKGFLDDLWAKLVGDDKKKKSKRSKRSNRS